ncbi:pectate lyase superfamily protein-domain-containing protein [Aspergillus pseudoustus]|uniref:Pectate lyase superfamily protein-domain-containing protein n=1 Tax=Aspergillus pseudoustus TaxID=1810923 RepID=A0ABR4JWU0_9EURO
MEPMLHRDPAEHTWWQAMLPWLPTLGAIKIDIRLTDPNAYFCAIHWQVAQGTSLENIEFYALTGTAEQGIYMENGSGGFLSDLTCVGGNFGAYFGNQKFTTSHGVLFNCNIALQIHWGWAWTMQDIVTDSCDTGIIIIGGAGGPMSKATANPSLYAKNSTALLVQNTGFFNVKDAIVDDVLSQTLVAGGDEVFIDNWGFGMFSTKSGVSNFANGINIPSMNRTNSLLAETGYVKPNFPTRCRPKYHDIGKSQIMDVKVLGAKRDGVTDDGPVLNAILQNAANLSSIAWSQIMAKGSKFGNELEPRVMVKVGEPGDVGIVEIQDILFTVSGATAGAVLMEWDVHESTQGSADTHFRAGGAIGSALQAEECPKLSGSVNPACKAASLLLHLTPKSSAYMENVWVWVADHELDKITQDQIDIHVARGVFVESQGPTWLYGTASEHCVFYQYQLSLPANVLLGMIRTESPYYQPAPKAPKPFTLGIFPNDPTFDNCPSDSTTCAVTWAVRILGSETVYLLGAGLYSWFSDYSQACLDTDNCQERGFHIEESNDIWIYNLCTKAIVEMTTPVKELVTLAVDNRNGFLSCILAWVRKSSDTTIGQREFEGFQVYSPDSPMIDGLTDTCQTALTQTIKCHTKLRGWQQPTMRRSLGNATLTDEVCDAGCGRALRAYYVAVTAACQGQNFTVPAGVTFPERAGGTIWTAYNETCLKDPSTDEYCTDVINAFTPTETFEEMPHDELCSSCYITLHKMMQNSPYSVYHDPFQSDYLKARLEYIYSQSELTADIHLGSLRAYNPWINYFCDNLALWLRRARARGTRQ